MKKYVSICIICIILLFAVSCNSENGNPTLSSTPFTEKVPQTQAPTEFPQQTATIDTTTATPISTPENTPSNIDNSNLDYWTQLAIDLNCTIPDEPIGYPASEYKTIKRGLSYQDLVAKFGVPIYVPYNGQTNLAHYKSADGYEIDVYIFVSYNVETQKTDAVVTSVQIPEA